MPRLQKQHFPALVMDGSCPHFFTGVLNESSNWSAQMQASGAPLEHLHASVEQVLSRSQLQLAQIKSFIYCSGPGSILGLRLCAMAIKTWQSVAQHPVGLFNYDPLQLAACQALQAKKIAANAWLICAWKKDYWHQVSITDGAVKATQVIQQAELNDYSGPIYYMQQRKKWEQPANSIRMEFQPDQLHAVLSDPTWLQATQTVTLSELGQSKFEKWSTQLHRSSTATRLNQ